MIQISNKYNCCGCEACEQVCPTHCITMVADAEGFLYPKVDVEKCINCHKCERICPELLSYQNRAPLQSLASYNNEDKIRIQATSGGVFGALAKNILDKGGVVFGARFTDDYIVIHDSDDKSYIEFTGSKYVQSSINNSYKKVKQFLKEGRNVLFSGTPCQVRGLLNIVGDNPKLITVDFICHGVPSPSVWSEYLKHISDDPTFTDENGKKCYIPKNSILTSINFRDKSIGWVFSQMAIKCKPSGINNSITFYSPKKKNLYTKAFLNDITLRPSCYTCKFKSFVSGSDFTIGDFWGVKSLNLNFDTKKGVSCVFTNTQKAVDLINTLDITNIEVKFEDILSQNPSILYPTKEPANRSRFFSAFEKDGSIIPLLKKYSKIPFKAVVRWQIIRLLQMSGLLKFIKRIR